MNRREWYGRTEETWPAEMPTLEFDEAVRATRKLYRFVRGQRCEWEFKQVTGNRSTWMHKSKVWSINLAGDWAHPGWKGLVHSLSHWLGGGHSKEHARMEARMIREVLKRGWLDGSLRTPARPEPTPRDRDALRLTQIAAGIVRWERKLKRAENALRKLARRRAYYAAKTTA